MSNIPITKPYIDNRELAKVKKVLDSGWLSQGPIVKEFENKFARFVGSKYAIAASSCTTALHLALLALGIKKGDEVIVPSFTFIASFNAVEYTGAKPVFCDIKLDTFNIDPDLIEKCISKRTKAIMPVHLFGLTCDMDKINAIAKKHKIFVIEDAACAVLSYFKGKHAGTFGDAGCFSFHPRKSLTTGEGGIVTTDDSKIASKISSLRSHGGMVSDLERHKENDFLLPEHDELGFNYRMTDIQAAVGLAQLDKIKKNIAERRKIAHFYSSRLKESKIFKIPSEPKSYTHAYQSYALFYEPEKPTVDNIEKLNRKRNEFLRKLKKLGISTRQATHAVHLLGYYKNKYNLKPLDYPNSLFADKLSFSIPLYFGLPADKQKFIVESLKKCAE